MFGFRYLSKSERENNTLLSQAWTVNSTSQAAAIAQDTVLGKKAKFFGFSKMLIKSLIFAVAGILAALIFRLINVRKVAQLRKLEQEEEE